MTKKILVCDDEPYILMALTDAVEMEGYECVTAINGKEALMKARETLPDLIMLDIMMPFMDGFEVCRELKADAATRDIPVIMLTAKSQQVDIQKGRILGRLHHEAVPPEHPAEEVQRSPRRPPHHRRRVVAAPQRAHLRRCSSGLVRLAPGPFPASPHPMTQC
jgi:CheY-like chemotaxis protein